jgi:hypothetical protein
MTLAGACGSSGAGSNAKTGGAGASGHAGGSTGSAGASGSTGSAGASGATGVAGASGSGGSATSGAGGAAGASGADGAAGASGSGGSAGAAGAAGTPDGGSQSEGGVGGQGGSCPTGFAECDNNPATVCEQPLNVAKNCGACGRDCTIDGAGCTQGLCDTVQLFSATDMPFGSDNSGARSWAFDSASNVAYWVGFNDYSVRGYPFDGSAAKLIWQPATAATAGTESIAVTGGNIYWSIGGTSPTVFQKAVTDAASVAPIEAFHPVARASFLRVQGTSFYWATGDYQDPTAPTTGYIYTRAIAAAATDAGTAIVTVDQGNFNDFKAFQPTSNALYWISDNGTAPYEMRTTPLAGGTPAAVPLIPGAPGTPVAAYGGVAPTLYAVGATIYFTRNLTTAPALNGIYRYATGDTAPTPLVAAPLVTNFVVDGTSIYYLLQNSNQVFKAPIAGGTGAAIANAFGYKIVGQDAKYLYVLHSDAGSSTLAKVIK